MAEKKRKTGIVIFAYFVALLKKSLKSKIFGCFVFFALRLYNLVPAHFFLCMTDIFFTFAVFILNVSYGNMYEIYYKSNY